jgi:hypothetical protein
MKSLKIWSLAVVLLLAMVGCKPNPGPGPDVNGFDAIENEWKLVSVNGVANDFNVYISFSDGFFAMYQQVYTLNYKFYEGQYSVSGNKLTGEYFDAGAWKCAYTGGVSTDGKTLTLKSDEENPITCVYEACTIPEDVKNEAVNGTRAADVLPFL